MRALVQRVSSASVEVDGEMIAQIGRGYLVLVGFTHEDTEEDCIRLAKKIGLLRVFSDENDKINLSLEDISGSILCVSQFTLYADCRKGHRPSFTQAMEPGRAEQLYGFFCTELDKYAPTQKGIFGADMKVTLCNDGPFTVMLE
ncbi:MAG: D-tyrosyl-tRNA(Tyr) deacylase [Oscillospiraceae bacterium]|nr:D-tyrosyl-tRNA(Tyr) deacylase [Oscillospiraceae bacterium]MBQ8978675.1 D-tyrosyl-tRNA(Tyr) deacylase [Oscillospiraceae bacterium]